jgi:hypothetical protein
MYIGALNTFFFFFRCFLFAGLASTRGGGACGIFSEGCFKERSFYLKDFKIAMAMKIRLTRTVKPMMKTKARAC